MLPGLVTGLFQAAVFNPWDRALFLSVVHNRPFLTLDNFRSPFQGVAQTLAHRTISGGLYFVLQDAVYDSLSRTFDSSRTDARVIGLAGLLAGAANGAALNSIAAVKYHGWATAGGERQFSFWSTARHMYCSGGVTPFVKGTRATVVRDSAFGVVYEVLRHSPLLVASVASLTSAWSASASNASNSGANSATPSQFTLNMCAAVCATVVSAPFNYVRNIQYASDAAAAPTSVVAELGRLVREARADASPWQALQRRLRLGWGSVRVGAGMAVGAHVYESVQQAFA